MTQSQSKPKNATPLPWEAQPFDADENGIALIGLPTGGLVAWVTLHPTEVDAKDPTRAQANAAVILDAVNSHASLKARIVQLERGLTWIVNSPSAHPANMVKVAEDALSHAGPVARDGER
mgnify:CR=1 FL=1